MSQPHMDNNDLARFLDGAMPEEERGSTVAHLSGSDADAELLADAAYLLRELEAEEGVVVTDDDDTAGHAHADDVDTGTDPKVVPLRPPSTRRTRPRRLPARWLALAAMVAGVLLVPLALSRSGSPGTGDYAALLANHTQGLPAGWTGRRPWPVTRGPGDLVAENAFAARIGALNVDLDLAIAAGHAEQTDTLAGQIAYLLENASSTGPGLVAPRYREIGRRASEPPEDLAASLAEARDELAEVLDADYFALGAWAEAARIAADSRDAAFFRRRASRKMMDRAALLRSLDPEARTALEAIRTASRQAQPDWTVLQEQTDELLRQIGS